LMLYREALVAGAQPRDLGIRYGIAALSTGDLDSAAACFDRMLQSPDRQAATAAAAAGVAVWAARGVLAAGPAGSAGAPPSAAAGADAGADDTGGTVPASPIDFSRAALAALGAGTAPPPVPALPPGAHDTLTIASAALGTAVVASLGTDVAEAVDGLML